MSRDSPISSPVLIEALGRQDSAPRSDQAGSPLYCETMTRVVDGSLGHKQPPPFSGEEPAVIPVLAHSHSGSIAPACATSNRDSTISYAQNDRGTISKRLEAALCVANPSETVQDITVLQTQNNRNSTIEYAQMDRGMISSKLRTHLHVVNPTIEPAPKTPSNRDSTGSYVYTDRDYIPRSVYRPLIVIIQTDDLIFDESTLDNIAAHAQDNEELALPSPLPNTTRVSQFGPASSAQLHLEREQMDDDREDFIMSAREIRLLYRSASKMFLGKLTNGLKKVRSQLETPRGCVEYTYTEPSS